MPPTGSGSSRPLSAVEEIRLISDAKRGHAESFEALVDRYMGPAIHVAMGYTRNRDDAVDLAQEAFFRVFKSLDRFRDGEPFAPWFFRILRNACLSFLEKRRRRRAWFLKDDRRQFTPCIPFLRIGQRTSKTTPDMMPA